MTDGVARELEQAEARLEAYVLDRYGINGDALDELCDAAIEVGRLRALAVTGGVVERGAKALCEDDGDFWSFREGLTNPAFERVRRRYRDAARVVIDAALTAKAPDPQELVRDLLRALGEFDGARSETPQQVWEGALAKVRALAAREEVSDG